MKNEENHLNNRRRAKIARFLQLELEHEGYAVKVAYDGLKGYEIHLSRILTWSY